MLSWVNDVERTSHAAARLEYHHSSDVQTIIARARDLQDIRERWTVPTFMDGSGREGSALERVKRDETLRLRILAAAPGRLLRRLHVQYDTRSTTGRN